MHRTAAHVRLGSDAGAASLGGLVPNVVATALWLRRDRVAPYPAIQTLFAVAGLSVLAAVVALAHLDALPEMSPGEPAGLRHAWLLLLYPGLMLMCFFQERAARRRSPARELRGFG